MNSPMKAFGTDGGAKSCLQRTLQSIACLPLTDILGRHVGDHYYFDFFSLDVEGDEFDVLITLDFQKYKFGIILVECGVGTLLKNLLVRSLLESNGYKFMMEHRRSIRFMNADFHQIYSHLAHVQYISNSEIWNCTIDIGKPFRTCA